MTTLTAISPLDGRYSEKLDDLRPLLSEYGLMKQRVFVEIRWFQYLAEHAHLPQLPKLSDAANTLLDSIINHFSEEDAARIKQIEKMIRHDVKAVEYFLKEQTSNHSELSTLNEFIHFGCTSEDINNLSYALICKAARADYIVPTLSQIISSLSALAHEYADQPLLARTHGQPATPTSVGKEIANVVYRLQRQLKQLNAVELLGKMNGASGNYNALSIAYPTVDWPRISEQFIVSLGLGWNPYTTQIEPHDYIAELCGVLMLINTILIDFNRDMWGYISLGFFTQKIQADEVGSSTMPHKVNPIDFENAEGNAGLSNALLGHFSAKLPISRWQRDLSDSTVLRNVGVAIAYAILAYRSTLQGLSKITLDQEKIAADLDQHWEVLGEAIQTILRRDGIDQPYEQLKAFTRGKKIAQPLLHDFIRTLTLSDETRKVLLTLTPGQYIGYAVRLAKKI